jgi:hypothetical protein
VSADACSTLEVPRSPRLPPCIGLGQFLVFADFIVRIRPSVSGVLVGEGVTGLHQIVCHTQVMWGTLVMWRTHLAVNKISVGGLTANEYALDWVPLC